MLHGNCLCGVIEYEINTDNTPEAIIFCHCQRCRKWNGSAYNAAIALQAKDLTILKDEDKLKAFSVDGVNRFFCSECGANIMTSRDSAKEVVRLRVGTLNTPIYPKKKYTSILNLKLIGILYVMVANNFLKALNDPKHY